MSDQGRAGRFTTCSACDILPTQPTKRFQRPVGRRSPEKPPRWRVAGSPATTHYPTPLPALKTALNSPRIGSLMSRNGRHGMLSPSSPELVMVVTLAMVLRFEGVSLLNASLLCPGAPVLTFLSFSGGLSHFLVARCYEARGVGGGWPYHRRRRTHTC